MYACSKKPEKLESCSWSTWNMHQFTKAHNRWEASKFSEIAEFLVWKAWNFLIIPHICIPSSVDAICATWYGCQDPASSPLLSPASPDLGRCDFWLLPLLKHILPGECYDNRYALGSSIFLSERHLGRWLMLWPVFRSRSSCNSASI